MKKYLDNTFFTFEGVTDERFYTYKAEDNKKGQIIVELSTDLSTAEIIHNDLQGNTYSYEVFNQKELQDTIEYVLGRKVVSEDQWKQASENKQSIDVELDDWDIIN